MAERPYLVVPARDVKRVQKSFGDGVDVLASKQLPTFDEPRRRWTVFVALFAALLACVVWESRDLLHQAEERQRKLAQLSEPFDIPPRCSPDSCVERVVSIPTGSHGGCILITNVGAGGGGGANWICETHAPKNSTAPH